MGKSRGSDNFQLYRGNFRNVIILLSLGAILIKPDPNPTRLAIGAGIVALGSLIHLLIKGQLVRNVIICNEGFYGVVRHPYYFANFVIDSGFCVLSSNEIVLYAFPFLFFWAYGPAINNEEKYLEDIHGQAYRDFRAKVPQILPSTGCYKLIPQILRNFTFSRITSQEVKRLLRLAASTTLLVFLNTALSLDLQTLKSWPPHSRTHLLAAISGGLTVLLFLVALCVPRKPRPRPQDGGAPAGVVADEHAGAP